MSERTSTSAPDHAACRDYVFQGAEPGSLSGGAVCKIGIGFRQSSDAKSITLGVARRPLSYHHVLVLDIRGG